jgi:malic enzyme
MPAMAKPASRAAKPASAPKKQKAKPSAAAGGSSHPPYFEVNNQSLFRSIFFGSVDLIGWNRGIWG